MLLIPRPAGVLANHSSVHWLALSCARLLLRDPSRHALIKQIQRQRPAVQDLVVESARIIMSPQFALRLLAKPQDIQLSEFVPKRLPRICNVPVRLRLDVRFILRGKLME